MVNSMEEQKNIKSKIFSGFIWRFGERITAQLVSLLVSIVLARLLSPEHYGAVALVMVFINIANVFVSNGLGNSLIQKKDADSVDFSSIFYINVLMSLILYGILFLIAPLIGEFYGMPELCLVLRVLGIRIPVAAINSIQHAYVSRHMLFKRFFWSTLFGTVLSGVVGIFLAYKGFGIWALVAQYLTNTCTDTVVLWFTVKWRPTKEFSLSRSRQMVSYGWKLLVSGLLDTGYSELRNLIIGKLYTSADLAYYNQADKYPKLIVNNVNTSIGSVIFPVMSQSQDNPEKIKQMTRKAIQISSFLIWPIMVGLAAVSRPLVSVVLTDKWISCVPYMQIFCFSYGLWPIHTANLQVIKAMGRSDLFLRMEVIKKIMGCVLLIVSLPFGPFAIAVSLLISGVLSTFINAYPNRALLNYNYREQLRDLLPSLGLSLIMAIVISQLERINVSDILLLAIQVICGALIYVVLSIITKQAALVYLVDILKKKKSQKKNK